MTTVWKQVGTAAAFAIPMAVAVILMPGTAVAQEERDEPRLLREATSMEVRGRYGEAREILEEILRENPTSAAAIFSLERVLRPVGSVREVLPWADRYLEREPRAEGVRYLVLRVLSEVDSTVALEPAVNAWIDAAPTSTEAYVEGARVLERAFGGDAALDVLRRGRDRVADPRALSAETGEVLLRAGEPERAAEAWAGAIGPDGEGSAGVARRLERVEATGTVVERLVDLLDAEPTTTARRRAAVRIAVDGGMPERAVEVARRVAPDLTGPALRTFLSETAAGGEEAALPAVTLWAWTELSRIAVGDRERSALQTRIASAALAAGDTAAAVEAQARLARSLEPGSAERRKAMADLVRMESRRTDGSDPGELLAEFRAAFPDAPELDELASGVAAGLRARGRGEDAVEVLDGVPGPQSALERAYLLFESDSLEAGLEALLRSTRGIDPSRATGVIQLAALLEGLPPRAASLAARTAGIAHRGDVDEALEILREGLEGADHAGVPALLAHGARLADEGGRPGVAAELRERLLEAHPDAPESAEAGLALARWRARTPEGVPAARSILEALILARPNSPVVPAARRELERLGGRPGSTGGAR